MPHKSLVDKLKMKSLLGVRDDVGLERSDGVVMDEASTRKVEESKNYGSHST